MKRILVCALATLMTIAAFGQTKKIPQRLEISQVEVNDGAVELEVFVMPVGEEKHYYLSVGTVGIGDDLFQLNIDPVSELFVYLGNSLAETLESFEQMKALYKTELGTSIQMPGCLSVAWPHEEKMEPVTITLRKPLISKMLEFSVDRGRYLSATFIGKGDLGALITGVKLYKKIHPKEK